MTSTKQHQQHQAMSTMFQLSTNYEELNVIGTGAYGTVYKARDLGNEGNIVALKKVRVALTEDGVPMSTLREIALLKQLDAFQHPNVVKLLDVCHGPRLEREGQLVLFLVFEHLEQDLDDYIKRLPSVGMSRMTIQRLSRELLTGVDFLHSHRIIHRDLKPQNLLISSQGRLKLADFGLAKTYDFEMKLTTVVVTLWYRSPEVLLGEPYHSSVDIWSSGCIMAEMFQRTALFPGTSEGNQLEKIFELTGRPSESQWPRGISVARENFLPTVAREPREFCPRLCDFSNDLLKQMLAFNPRERPSALQCLQHPYFTQEPM
ncbi:cyclin-dependent kinase 4 [Toxorhynchites rutilus septentrionalis]|uniref:cyclin-dependent kinase 4 n=1 Tax=Toxorhynchites rutilus septentrionalis TaxID=329112 RepID=UPI00247A5E61|nr:cyclin-dependent kinase 4 [Toxorhynchites rutilus septentrionalis]